MDRFKGTSGPWTFEGGNNENCEVNAKETTIDLTRCERNTGNHIISREEMVANAILIAAAPDLLEALIDLTDWYNNHIKKEGITAPLFRNAEKAINKSLGKDS